MKRSELKARLTTEGFKPDSYSIDSALPAFEGLILEQAGGKWRIEHFERGMRRELARFDREEDACAHMYDLLLKHFR